MRRRTAGRPRTGPAVLRDTRRGACAGSRRAQALGIGQADGVGKK